MLNFIATMLGLVLSDTTVAIIVAQIPITLTAVGVLISSLRNGTKADKIATSVDGNTSKLQTNLDLANGRIEQLLRFYPTPVPINALPEALTHTGADDEPAKIEIVNKDTEPVPTKTIPKPK